MTRTIDVGGRQGRGNPAAYGTEGTLADPIGETNVLGTCFWTFFAFVAGFSLGWLFQTSPLFN